MTVFITATYCLPERALKVPKKHLNVDRNTKLPYNVYKQSRERRHVKLTTKSEYSILALIHIGRHQKKGFVKIDDICSEYNLPNKYLEQLLLVLKQKRYVKTKRGASGGYMLGMPANQISMAEIIRLMDGALAPTESVSMYFFSHTPLEKENKIIKVFRDIRDYAAKKLENLKLTDLI